MRCRYGNYNRRRRGPVVDSRCVRRTVHVCSVYRSLHWLVPSSRCVMRSRLPTYASDAWPVMWWGWSDEEVKTLGWSLAVLSIGLLIFSIVHLIYGVIEYFWS